MSNTSSTRWFQLRDDIGVTADGNLEPLANIGLTMMVPVMVGREVTNDPHRYGIKPADRLGEQDAARIVPGTRIVETRSAQVAATLAQTGHYEEIDKPTRAEITAAGKRLTDAAEEAGTHEPDPAERPQEYAEDHANDETKGA